MLNPHLGSPPPIRPSDLEPWGLCCCLRCRGIVRDLADVEPERTLRVIPWDHRRPLFFLHPELIANLFAAAELAMFDGRHLC